MVAVPDLHEAVEKATDRAQNFAGQHQALDKLKDSDAWFVLSSIASKARETLVRQYAQALLSGSEVDQRQLDYDRGLLDGMKFLLERPERIESRFNDAVDKLQKLIDRQESEE